MGSAGCQPAFLGSLPENSYPARGSVTLLKWRLRRSITKHPASCRMLQAGGMALPVPSSFPDFAGDDPFKVRPAVFDSDFLIQ